MNFFPFHIGDFNNATMHLTEIEECFYHRALAWYYSNEAPLPVEKTVIYRFLRARTDEARAAVDNVLADFFTLGDDGWHQSRCDAEIAAYRAKGETSRVNGKKGGRPPKGGKNAALKNPDETQDETQNNPAGYSWDSEKNPDETQPKGNQEPITNNQEPIHTHTGNPVGGWPDMQVLNNALKAAGSKPVTVEQVSFELGKFTATYENHHLTDNQRLYKLVSWMQGVKKPPTTPHKAKPVNPHSAARSSRTSAMRGAFDAPSPLKDVETTQ